MDSYSHPKEEGDKPRYLQILQRVPLVSDEHKIFKCTKDSKRLIEKEITLILRHPSQTFNSSIHENTSTRMRQIIDRKILLDIEYQT